MLSDLMQLPLFHSLIRKIGLYLSLFNVHYLQLCPYLGPSGRRTEGEKKSNRDSSLPFGSTATRVREEGVPLHHSLRVAMAYIAKAVTKAKLERMEKKGRRMPTYFLCEEVPSPSQTEHQKTSEAFSMLMHISGWSCIKFRLEETSGEQNAFIDSSSCGLFTQSACYCFLFKIRNIHICSYIHSGWNMITPFYPTLVNKSFQFCFSRNFPRN